MIQFCTYCFGNEGWLQAFQLKQLRDKQKKEHQKKKFMPNVTMMKTKSDEPFDVDAEVKTSLKLVTKEKQLEEEAKIRNPDDPYQSKLLTGYERQITKKQLEQDGRSSMEQTIDLSIQDGDTKGGSKVVTSVADRDSSMLLSEQINMLGHVESADNSMIETTMDQEL